MCVYNLIYTLIIFIKQSIGEIIYTVKLGVMVNKHVKELVECEK